MKVYRMTEKGYIEELETVGSYKPIGWHKTKASAIKHGKRKTNKRYKK